MIPQHIINLARRNADLMKCNVMIYKFRNEYVMLPVGYEVHANMDLLGYVTRDLTLVEKGTGDDESTKNSNTEGD